MLYNSTRDAFWDLSLIHNHYKNSWKNDPSTQACLKVYICLKVREFLMPWFKKIMQNSIEIKV